MGDLHKAVQAWAYSFNDTPTIVAGNTSVSPVHAAPEPERPPLLARLCPWRMARSRQAVIDKQQSVIADLKSQLSAATYARNIYSAKLSDIGKGQSRIKAVEIFKDKNRRWRIRIRGNNNEKLGAGEAYSGKAKAYQTARLLADAMGTAVVEVEK